ncbi:ParB/RepB/Spo0J family partition protein [Rhodospirillum centenum]|uniref:Chromosome partitioning protein ParB n=1 Tax=Rhodospirillum centenum (strain ATCC 51521 / SW) TaxID=414684 RepID=B6IV61_RHOCS|nr:ParB/RepB/Spo0J family partition protein [Rhodospirillum centenum]ACJ00185.1 chromosome partitioning protein ParB [Rhodospirillum centenum SW]
MDDVRKEDSRKRPGGLGRGLSALFGDAAPAEGEPADRARLTRLVPIDQLHPGRYQPRRRFDDEEMRALVDSVRERGVLQPLLVRKDEDSPPGAPSYEIIAGERRWRAAQLAGLHEVPVLVRTLTDREALEIALIENIQRQDLTPLEEAEGFRRLMDEFSHTQEDLARAVGKSRSHVANMLRLLALPDEVKRLVQEGQLSMGHARALLTAHDPAALAQEVVKRGLNVRQTEQLVKDAAAGRQAKLPAVKPPDTVALEREVSTALGLKVVVAGRGPKGVLQIHYKTLDQLDGVLSRILGQR